MRFHIPFAPIAFGLIAASGAAHALPAPTPARPPVASSLLRVGQPVMGRGPSTPARPSTKAEAPVRLPHANATPAPAIGGGARASETPMGTIRQLVSGDIGKFSLRRGGTYVGGVSYTRHGDVVAVEHVVIEPAFRGNGVARAMVAHVVAWARASGVRIRPACSFAAAEFKRHPDWADVLAR